jgi:hypothetical protein
VLLLLLLGRLRVSLTLEKLFVRSLVEAQRGRKGGHVHVTQKHQIEEQETPRRLPEFLLLHLQRKKKRAVC